ncbi:reverse transcriptase domain-containing protein [Tanacetum coccineum]
MRKQQLSSQAKEYFAIQRCLLACGMPEPLTSVWWIKHSINRSEETSKRRNVFRVVSGQSRCCPKPSIPKCLKDVQKLNGKLASLNRFLAKSAEKSLPFFKTLKNAREKAISIGLRKRKKRSREKEELIVYLAAAKETVSAVLMTEQETKQMPIYFASRAFRGPEVNYTSMEKLVLALVHASKRLKRIARYIQTQSKIGERADNGRTFIVKQPEDESPDTLMGEEEELPEPWILFTDGSSCTDGSGAGLILTNPKGMEFTYALRFRFDATNNEARILA